MKRTAGILFVAIAALCAASAVEEVLAGRFQWTASEPLIAPLDRGGDHYYSVKDPSVVRYQNRWHVFCTIRGKVRSHQIEYLSFADWANAGKARREMLHMTGGYFCAPEVFYFRPRKKWYMIYQVSDRSRTPALQPAWSTNDDISAPGSWTPPKLLFADPAAGKKGWIDFWVICDDRRAHLFFTTPDGQMWRADTAIAEFPNGWSRPQSVLKGDIFEASHTYRLKGQKRYVAIVEARAPDERRYYKAYTAETLEGAWTPLAATAEKPFASPANVRFHGERWTDSFSHGELLRDGYDETLTVDPAHLTFLFQGVADRDRQGKPYGEIPWRLGLLRM